MYIVYTLKQQDVFIAMLKVAGIPGCVVSSHTGVSIYVVDLVCNCQKRPKLTAVSV